MLLAGASLLLGAGDVAGAGFIGRSCPVRFPPTKIKEVVLSILTRLRYRLLGGVVGTTGKFAKEAREDESQRAAKSGETSADDTKVGFDDRPLGRVDAIPGDVEIGGRNVKGRDAKNGRDTDASTED